jgi:hypothetical protein
MKERPMLFSAPMVRAILDGRKTVTRRVVKPQPLWVADPSVPFKTHDANPKGIIYCPHGKPGDQLWVREAFSGPRCMDASDGCKAVPPSKWGDGSRIWYWADGNPTEGDWTRPRPSIHMPRWASRILLEIVAVRVERLQDISEADAVAEGCKPIRPELMLDGLIVRPGRSAVEEFRHLWEQINGGGSWEKNPWVWVIEFKKLEQQEQA